MSDWSYTEEELKRYFTDPDARRAQTPPGGEAPRRAPRKARPSSGVRGFFYRRIADPKKAQAAYALSILTALALLFALGTGLYTLLLRDDLPSLQDLENPQFQLATVAYTADGKELARYARQNRSWAHYEDISPHVVNALVATEDHRFYTHWGVDAQGILAAVGDILTKGDLRGASTITQQLARNLYNKEIGFDVSVTRKLKEMVTAVELERRYTKQEVIEMYLNTVEFGNNAFGIEAASRTFFGKAAQDLDPLESATLVGMLQAITYYNPVRNPENAQRRRNVVLAQMVKHGYLSQAFLDENKDAPVETNYNSSEITASLAPYFAEHVRNWMRTWSKENNRDFYAEGLVVYTTLDSRLQELAYAAVTDQMKGLQAVIDYEWSRPSGYSLGTEVAPYLARTDYEPFSYFWSSQRSLTDRFIRETPRFRSLRGQDVSAKDALAQLRADEAFMDSLKANKTRLEAGLVSIDPRNGYVKAWVGGRSLEVDWFDHVSIAKRQPGSTFKPFVYTAAIDNGYSPYYMLLDSTFTYRDAAGNVWSPGNVGGSTGRMMSLREALANSVNTVTGRLVLQVGASNVAFYARRMGVKSELDEVPALALGTSDVSLMELTSAYATLANGGLYYEPTAVTRIEDRFGNVLYEANPVPEAALSEETAYTVVDMLRGTIDRGTATRINWQFNLRDYDLAGKTGTTQNNADGWFMLMHPELVTGAWVGFNDRRISFRSNFWGQGAHNALFLVGDFFRRATRSRDVQIGNERFPMPEDYGIANQSSSGDETKPDEEQGGGRVGW